MRRSTTSLFLLLSTSAALSQIVPLDRSGQTIAIEPYAPNIVRVTLSTIAKEAQSAPGYGFVGKPELKGWEHAIGVNGADTYTSSRLTVTVSPADTRNPNNKLPDTANFFSGSVPGTNIRFTLPDGSQLTEMDGWQMAELNQKDDTLKSARGIRTEDMPLYTVGASFLADDDEHTYDLGENQEGYLDHRQRPVTCPANYLAPCFPNLLCAVCRDKQRLRHHLGQSFLNNHLSCVRWSNQVDIHAGKTGFVLPHCG